MAGFKNVKDYVEAQLGGRLHVCHLRKVPSQASVAYWWTDLSMAAGNPVPNYYASTPLEAATLSKWRGLFHGDDKSPAEKYLADWMLVTPTANMVGVYRLMDYLLYYPFIDLDDADEQVLDNTVTLPRYADGAGVHAMMVAAAPTVGSGSFTFRYYNQDGVEKTSPVQYCGTTGASISSIITSQPATVAGQGPFLKLDQGDTGIRSVISVTMSVLNGGLGSLVLVKPLCETTIREIGQPMERTLIAQRPGPIRIYDGAYLNMICNTAGSIAAGLLTGRLNFVWTE